MPSNVYARVLFGGALFCAGQHAPVAGAQVSDASFRFVGNVNNIFEFDGYGPYGYPQYTDTGINESFDVQGGAGVLPFSRRAMGGYAGASGNYAYFPATSVFASGDGSLSQTGELSFTGSTDAFAGVSFPSLGNFSINARVEVEFVVEQPTEFSIEVTSFFFDNDVGSAGISLVDGNNSPIFRYFDTFGFEPTASGTLQPGSYLLSISSASSGIAGARLNVVPAPTTAGLLGIAGLTAARRRR
ncbi:MAG: PEP-CTERM sorting domain-containing protein [Phycisphaerales bacterium]